MAFDPSGWSPDVRPSGMKIHTYISADDLAAVNTSGYFNDVIEYVAVGDVIFIYDTTTPACSYSYVNAASSGTVDIVNGTTITNTDGD